MKKRRTVILGLLISATLCFAQQDSLRLLPGQVSFVYPMGTSGANAINNSYVVSLNILTGATGANEGFEVAGIANVNRYYSRGAQFAGICNINGSFNEGAQFAGICNITGGASDGGQFAGICNLTNGAINGMQACGIANAGRDVIGFQLAGISNVAGRVEGFQAAGISNVADSVDGFQAAGISNVASDVEGAQAAGIANLSGGAAEVQVAGIANKAKTIEGAQIAGIANVAGYVHGVQLAGIVNICDSIDGVPLALISIVKHGGYRRWEAWGSEAFHANLSYKIGVEQLYTIISLGYKTGERDNNMGFGMGIGTQRPLGANSSLNLEGHMYHISRNLVMDEDNFMYTLRLNYVQHLGERLAVFAGPSVNMLHAYTDSDAIDIAPGYGMGYSSVSYNWRYWVGFNAGVRF